MAFSIDIRSRAVGTLQVNVRGPVVGYTADELRAVITEAIELRNPNELLVNLWDVTILSSAGVSALLAGYVASVDWGTSYRVTEIRGQPRALLQAVGVLDMLADSNDLGALVLAVIACSEPGAE
ncbi:STAS domain-containing protein [Amycolatopsis sp. NPDC051372]|uniref:STAS domain-containing protein n=1 Tax=Amycolatopsis sp. NPDC051372 TaxID=3155669 RepID=UPI0034459BDB